MSDRGHEAERVRPANELPLEFLRALANVFSTVGLYGLSHPVAQRAFEAATDALGALLRNRTSAVFSFFGEEVVFGDTPLRELKDWPWSARFTAAGIQRVEFLAGMEPRELEGFVAEALDRLELSGEAFEPVPHPHIRYGMLGFRVPTPEGVPGRADAPPVRLEEESGTVGRIHEVAAETGAVPAAEAAAVVRALAVAMHQTKALLAPIADPGTRGGALSAHCLAVSVLAMSLAEFLNLADADVRAVGEAALLHDIGKSRLHSVPVAGPGGWDPGDRELVARHPVEGARILLRGSDRHALAAVVAYEHHMHWNGKGGYPRPSRAPHRFSRMVQVCDAYDALRSPRAFRPSLTSEAALAFLEGRAGAEFDPELVPPFVEMVRAWEPTVEPEGGEARDSEGREPLGPGDLSRMAPAPFDADLEEPPARPA